VVEPLPDPGFTGVLLGLPVELGLVDGEGELVDDELGLVDGELGFVDGELGPIVGVDELVDGSGAITGTDVDGLEVAQAERFVPDDAPEPEDWLPGLCEWPLP
jgi:hypothetical protein